jgi:hypothetical protein
MDRTASAGGRTLIQNAAILFGIIFLIVGVAGFIPGITTNYDRLSTFDGEGALLLGLFGINWLESVVHLLYGAAGLALARSVPGARNYFVVGGAIYIVLWLYGLVIDLESNLNFIGINTAANWLHFVLGVVMLGIGLVLGRQTLSTATDGGTRTV